MTISQFLTDAGASDVRTVDLGGGYSARTWPTDGGQRGTEYAIAYGEAVVRQGWLPGRVTVDDLRKELK